MIRKFQNHTISSITIIMIFLKISQVRRVTIFAQRLPVVCMLQRRFQKLNEKEKESELIWKYLQNVSIHKTKGIQTSQSNNLTLTHQDNFKDGKETKKCITRQGPNIEHHNPMRGTLNNQSTIATEPPS